MDLDAFVAANKDAWVRLDSLSRASTLAPDEARELVDLYRRTSTHLSMIRTQAADAALISELSSIIIRARRKMTGKDRHLFRSIARFFTVSFPAALYRFRAWWIATTIVSILFAFVMGTWIYSHPELHEQIGSSSTILQYVEHDFHDYYTENSNADFTMLVWSNNWFAALQTLAYGITVVGALQILFANMGNVAIAGALMSYHGHAVTFWGLIVPHGLLELTAIFVAAGVGLALFWSLIQPGARTRLAAFVYTAHLAIQVVFGLILTLFVSGFVEGYVTASFLPTFAQVGIGVAVWVAFLAYALVWGKKKTAEAEQDAEELPQTVSVE